MDYKNGKIYSIRSHNTDLIYIGSTCQPLSKRLSKHKSNYKNWLKTGKTQYTSYKIYELDDNPYIELIVNYPCSCKDELRREEGKYIRSLECVNRCIEGRTKKQWYADNKEHIKEIQKKWNEANIDKVKEIKKKYRETNREKMKQPLTCDCGSTYRKCDKARHERTNKHIEFTKL